MKPFRTSSAILSGISSLFPVSNGNAGVCISRFDKKAEIECFSDEKKFIDTKENELPFEVGV